MNAALKGLKTRHPSGQLKKSKKIAKSDVTRTVLAQRLKYISAKHAKKSEAGHLLGCLFLDELLEHRQYVAAQKVAEHFARYRIINGLSKPSIQIIDLTAIYGASFSKEDDEEKILKITVAYNDIKRVCKDSKYGDRAFNMLKRIIESDEILAENWRSFSWSSNYFMIRNILTGLAELYRIKNP